MAFNGQTLRQDRVEAGLNQTQFAKKVGISASYLCQIELGKREPSEDVVKKMVDVLRKALQERGIQPSRLKRIKPERYLPAKVELQCLRNLFEETMNSAKWKALELDRIDVPADPKVQRVILRLMSLCSGDTEAEELNKVEQYQREHANYWPSIEAYVRKRIHSRPDFTTGRFRSLAAFVKERFGYGVTSGSLPGLAWAIDVDKRKICLADSVLDIRRRTFHLAHAIGRIALNEDYDDFERDHLFEFNSKPLPYGLSDRVNIRQNDFRFERQVQILLSSYFASCVVMPRKEFFDDAERLGYDIWKLAQKWRVTQEQVMHRVTTMGKRGRTDMPDPIEFHFLRMNLAGGVLASWSGSGLDVPSRLHAPCVKWNAVSCFIESPHRLRVQLSQLQDGRKFLCISMVVVRTDLGGETVPLMAYSITLGCRADKARRLVYGRDVGSMPVVQVGTGCQRCTRDCAHRGHVLLSRSCGSPQSAVEDQVLGKRKIVVRKINLLNDVSMEEYQAALKTLGAPTGRRR